MIVDTPEALNDVLVVNQNIQPVVTRGSGAEVFDDSGSSYIDLERGLGVASVGHCHPTVVNAIKTQADQLLQVPGRHHSLRTLQLAKRLAELTDGWLRSTFFANSGAEANEGASKCRLKHAVNTRKAGCGIIALDPWLSRSPLAELSSKWHDVEAKARNGDLRDVSWNRPRTGTVPLSVRTWITPRRFSTMRSPML
jgi:hypothetical protein